MSINFDRLLNVARALEEARPGTDDRGFDMSWFVHPCGTPSCAIGHYASRTDLQDVFTIDARHMSAEVLYRGYKDWSFAQVGGEHFGLEQDDMDELFEKRGCGRARTADQAAAYIRNFVELNGGPKVVKS